MLVIPPIQITDARLTSTTIPEEVAPTYAGGTTYADGAFAGLVSVYGSPQIVWRSLQDSNTGNAQTEGDWWTGVGTVYPIYASGSSCGIGGIVTDLATHSLYESLVVSNTGNALTDVEKWKYIGKTNRFKMFDYDRNQKAVSPNSITFVLTPGKRINSIALKGIIANSYSLSVTSVSGGGEVYSSSGTLNTRITTTWSDYFYGEFTTRESLVFFDIPLYSDGIITINLSATSGNVGLSTAAIGTFVDVGETLQNATSDILNFSQVSRDLDGNAILTPARNIPKSRQQTITPKTNINKIIQLREELNGKSGVWFGLSDPVDGYFEAASILGFYRGFEIDMSQAGSAVINIELEEV
tara:strand:- start:670 stop:1731 length:1062 start_codon:yes stop_codon:yes gene_type:complete